MTVTDQLIQEILKIIPHRKPFRFIDTIDSLDENSCTGTYFFGEDEYFYEGHFPNLPITPSVILTETMGQIGVLPVAILRRMGEDAGFDLNNVKPIFTNTELKFKKPVYPNTKVTVTSEVIFYRLTRMKTKVWLTDQEGDLCCSGVLSGVILTNDEIKFFS